MKPSASLELPRRAPYGARLAVGRLVEIWMSDMRSVADWTAFLAEYRLAAASTAGRLVICADYRAVRVLTPTVADGVLECLKTVNARLERSALLLPKDAPTLRLQVERLVREAKQLSRRTFTATADVKAWLLPSLTDPERARLTEFLASGD